ncbi:hypothetical protein G5I_10535 [Acromyrmex echinatior]|uniref:Uncharacterized protein n=1 Tax=Acromyrmex echinatior TaxID=103372 RepID=F4WX44_ACREC|nr:hypothetical protein G5I_10535 [Acromyrmex echinatior]
MFATGVNTPIPTSDMASDLWRVTGQLYTEVATIGSRRTKWIISRTQEPSKLYSAEHDQTRVDTIIITVIFVIEITHDEPGPSHAC